jgi:hypothetical protein
MADILKLYKYGELVSGLWLFLFPSILKITYLVERSRVLKAMGTCNYTFAKYIEGIDASTPSYLET